MTQKDLKDYYKKIYKYDKLYRSFTLNDTSSKINDFYRRILDANTYYPSDPKYELSDTLKVMRKIRSLVSNDATYTTRYRHHIHLNSNNTIFFSSPVVNELRVIHNGEKRPTNYFVSEYFTNNFNMIVNSKDSVIIMKNLPMRIVGLLESIQHDKFSFYTENELRECFEDVVKDVKNYYNKPKQEESW